MKKIFKILSLFIFILIGYLTQTTLATELLPDAKKQIELPEFNPDWLENNLYPEFISLISTADDALSISQKIVEHNYNELRKALRAGNLDTLTAKNFLDYPNTAALKTFTLIDVYEVEYPWRRGITYLNFSQNPQTILEDVYQNADAYNSELKKYRDYLDRRDKILNENSFYYSIPSYPIDQSSPFYPAFNPITYLYISDLQIAKTLLLIQANEINSALDLFLYEYNLAETIALRGNADLLVAGFQIQRQELIYNLIHDLINRKIITHKNIEHELFSIILNREDLSEDFYHKKISEDQLSIVPYTYLSLSANRNRYQTIDLPWAGYYYYADLDVNETVNMLYLFYQELLYNIQNNRPLTDKSDEFQSSIDKYQKNNQHYLAPDYLQDIFSEDRLYNANAQTYQNTQLYLKSMESYKKITQLKILSIKDQHTIESMSNLLDHEDSPYIDLVTQKPLTINPKSGEISFTYYEYYLSNETSEKQIISIPLINQKASI